MEKSRGKGLSARDAAAFHLCLALGSPAGIGGLAEGATPLGTMFRPWREKNGGTQLLLRGATADWLLLSLDETLPFPAVPRDSRGRFCWGDSRGEFSVRLEVAGEGGLEGVLAGELAGFLRLRRAGLGWRAEGSLRLARGAKQCGVRGGDPAAMVSEIPAGDGEEEAEEEAEGEGANGALENETPLDEAPMDEAPMDEAPMDETPSNEIPLNETHLNETHHTNHNHHTNHQNSNQNNHNQTHQTPSNETPSTHSETPASWDWIPEYWRIPCETIREFNGDSAGCLCFEFEALATLANFAVTVFDGRSNRGIRLDGFRGVCTSRGEHVIYGDSVQAQDRILVMVNFARDYVREFREGERIGGLLVEDLGKLPWKKPVSIRSFAARRISAVFGDEIALSDSVDWMREVSNEEMLAECMSSYHLVQQCMEERCFPEWFLREAFPQAQKWKSGRFRWYETRIPNLWVEVEKTAEREEAAWKVVGSNGGFLWAQPIPSNHFESGREEYSKVWKRGIARDVSPPAGFAAESFEEFQRTVNSNFPQLFALLPRVDAACRETGELAWNLPPASLLPPRGTPSADPAAFPRECALMGVLLALNRRLLRLLAFLAVFPDAETAGLLPRLGGFAALSGFLLSSSRFLLAAQRLAALRVAVEPSIDAQRLPDAIPLLSINRIAARRERLQRLPLPARRRASVAQQLLRWVAAQPAAALRRAYVHHSHGGQRRAFAVRFCGEGGIDNGGLYRELFAAAMADLHDLQLFAWLRKTPNCADCAVTAGKDDFLWDESDDPRWLRALGRAVGTAVLSGVQVNLLLSPALWKIIAGEEVGEADLARVDASLSRFCRQVRNGELETTWSFPSFQGELRVHRGYPPETVVEPRETEAFCAWVLETAFAEQKRLCAAFRRGLDEVLCGALRGILRGRELEELVVGVGDVDVAALRSATKYEGFEPTDREIEWFWRALGEFSRAQRVRFLQFATARSRLPVFGHQTPLAVGESGDDDM